MQRVVEDVEVVERRLLDVVQRVHLGQHGPQHAQLVAQRQGVDRIADAEDPLQLGQLALAGARDDQVGVAPGDLGRRLLHRELQLGGQSRQPQQAQRVVAEDVVADHPQHPRADVVEPAVRVGDGTVGEGDGNRVRREVAARQVLRQRAVQGGEVDHAALVHDPPGAVALRQRKRRAAAAAGVRPGRGARVARHDDVPVVDRPAEQVVAHRAAHDPALVADERAAARGQLLEAHAATSRSPRSGRWRSAQAIS